MKKTALLLLLAAANAYAFSVTAYFTGQQEFVQTVTGQNVIRCHYRYNSQEFTQLVDFGSFCPMSIEIQ